MIKTGLVSVTFRSMKPEEIIALVKEAGLQGIEWGGDVHVPYGDIANARRVYDMMSDEGLGVAAYGSYYRVGCHDDQPGIFEKILETAVALHAPTIRVWAGNKASKDADEFWWERIIADSGRIAGMAGKVGVSVSYEFHHGTLTDTNSSAVRLLESVRSDNVRCYWQPPVGMGVALRAQGLDMIKTRLSNIHVYYWSSEGKRPLSEGVEDWTAYFGIIPDSGNHYALLEFVMNDSKEQFLNDAEVLKKIIGKFNK